ncbi:MAG TPA: hypothetical protein P5205_08245 [Candidatus Paceibacterota bacterium]|nr:hypothetical protein [Verrucomicrobiota bacterium]HSA10349.1 hypothetical protein [Candidatus Paceibacterota bacterium]
MNALPSNEAHSPETPPSRNLQKTLLDRFWLVFPGTENQLGPCLCRDIHTGEDAILIELSAASPRQAVQATPPPETHIQQLGVSLLFPRTTIRADGKLFAVAYPPSLTSLADNIALLEHNNWSATEAEAARIGSSLCAGFAQAFKGGFITFLDPKWIFFDTGGSIFVLALHPGQQSAAKDFNSPVTIGSAGDIARLMIRLLIPGPTSEEPEQAVRNIQNPALRSALIQALEAKVRSLEEFANLLEGAVAASSRWPKAKTNFVLALALLIVLTIGLFAGRTHMGKEQNQAKQATEDVRQAVYATVTQWRSFLLDYTDALPPHIPEAEQLLARADEFWANSEFERAKPLYARANLLYEAGLRAGKEILGRRNIAQEARLRTMTLGTGWRRLSASPYVEVPEAVKQAQNAFVEGDFRFLDRKYQDALMAYDLAAERFQSVPAAQLKALSQKHEARVTADRAKYAEQAWRQIAPAAGTAPPEAVQRASTRLAEGQALLTAGNDDSAGAAFQEACDLYSAATAALIKSMVSRQETANAQDRLADAAMRWRTLSKLLNTPDPPEITQAETLLQTAAEAAKSGKQDQAKIQLSAATEIFERQASELQERAGVQCEADTLRARQLIDSLQSQQATLETNLVSTRKNIEALNVRLLSERAPADQERLLKELQNARTTHTIASRLLTLCSTAVLGSPRYERAKDSIEQARSLILQGNKVAASALSGPAVADLETLSRLPSQMDSFLTQQASVEPIAESARRKIGPVARGQPLTKKLLADADDSLAQAADQLKSGNAEKAQQMLTDARLAYESLPAQAEQELLACATRADSEFRTDTAVAALHEVLELNPASQEAKRLLDQVQSKDRPRDRISIIGDSWRINGKALPRQPTKDDLERVLGKARTLSGNSGFVFDDYGIMAIPNPESGKIMLLTVYYGSPQYEHEPRKAYPGLVELEGIAIKHDHAMSVLASTLSRLNPKISESQKTLQLGSKDFRLHIAYTQSTNQIYTVSISASN